MCLIKRKYMPNIKSENHNAKMNFPDYEIKQPGKDTNWSCVKCGKLFFGYEGRYRTVEGDLCYSDYILSISQYGIFTK